MPKVNIHTPAGLDSFVDQLSDGPPVILADMGAGAGQVTYDWFETMYPDVSDAGIVFTAIGVVTADPASVESVLAWASRLQNRVEYLIGENSITDHADFTYRRESDQAGQRLRQRRESRWVKRRCCTRVSATGTWCCSRSTRSSTGSRSGRLSFC